MGGVVDPNIVGIVPETDAGVLRVVLLPEQSQGTVAGAGYIERVSRSHVADALRLLQSGNSAQDFAVLEVDHAYAVVAELGNEQALARHINRHMIDTAPYVAKWDLCLQLQRDGLDRLRKRLADHSRSPGQGDRRQETNRFTHRYSPLRLFDHHPSWLDGTQSSQ